MKPITVRNVPPHVAKAVKERAKRDRTSLNGAVIRLLEERLGEPEPSTSAIHHDLDFLFDTWTKEEADEFDRDLGEQRRVEPKLWK